MGELDANLRRLFDKSTDGMVVHRDGRIVYANPRIAEFLGYDAPDELLGRAPVDFVAPEQRALVTDRIRDTYEHRAVQPEIEGRLIRKDGADLPVEVLSIPILFDGEPSTLAHIRDVRVRKFLEAQLLASDRLASIGRLASAIAHDLKNPLAYVLTSLELAVRSAESIANRCGGDDTRDLHQLIAQSLEGIDRVRRIVRDVKMLSRGGEPENGPVGLREVIESCARMAANELHDRARLVLDVDDTPPVLGSESRVAQVLSNVLANAAHAIEPGSPDKNEVRVIARARGANEVVVEVRDTGAGMTQDVKAHAFEPFFTQRHGGGGSGLGLAIVQAIVRSLNGHVAIDSEPGRSTRVRITLPAAPDGDGVPR